MYEPLDPVNNENSRTTWSQVTGCTLRIHNTQNLDVPVELVCLWTGKPCLFTQHWKLWSRNLSLILTMHFLTNIWPRYPGQSHCYKLVNWQKCWSDYHLTKILILGQPVCWSQIMNADKSNLNHTKFWLSIRCFGSWQLVFYYNVCIPPSSPTQLGRAV